MNISELIEKYEEQLRDAEEYLESIEYEAAPSGEMNESLMMQAVPSAEIDILEDIIEDLKRLL